MLERRHPMLRSRTSVAGASLVCRVEHQDRSARPYGDVGCLVIADFTDHDDVGIPLQQPRCAAKVRPASC